MRYKITFKNQVRNWYDFVFQGSIFAPFILYAYFKSGTNGLFIFYTFLSIQFAFTFYLHLVYYIKNMGEEYCLEKDKIIKINNDTKTVYFTKDILKIVICKSANKDSWGIPFTTFETFRIARVYLNDGTNFIMTNLLEYDLEKPLRILQGVRFERRKGFSFFI